MTSPEEQQRIVAESIAKLPPDQQAGIRFRGDLQEELGLVGRNITLVPTSYVKTVYHLGCDENAAYAMAHVLENLVKDEDVPPSYQPEIKYMRELFRTCTRQMRTVHEEYPEGIFDERR